MKLNRQLNEIRDSDFLVIDYTSMNQNLCKEYDWDSLVKLESEFWGHIDPRSFERLMNLCEDGTRLYIESKSRKLTGKRARLSSTSICMGLLISLSILSFLMLHFTWG